jgi:hypothetical protein
MTKTPCDGLIAAVADGLGSEEHSDMAAQEAAAAAVSYCAGLVSADMGDDEILQVLKEAYKHASDRVEDVAYEKGYELDKCDTTLTLAVLLDGRLFYGQSGDSGLIALTEDGLYRAITTPQQDEEKRVYPLFSGAEAWVFGVLPEKTAAALLATDGMLGTFFPAYLADGENKLNIPLLRYYMDAQMLEAEKYSEAALAEWLEEDLFHIPAENVNFDDKTMVILLDTDVTTRQQPPAYYAKPDASVLEAWRKNRDENLYPSLARSEC